MRNNIYLLIFSIFIFYRTTALQISYAPEIMPENERSEELNNLVTAIEAGDAQAIVKFAKADMELGFALIFACDRNNIEAMLLLMRAGADALTIQEFVHHYKQNTTSLMKVYEIFEKERDDLFDAIQRGNKLKIKSYLIGQDFSPGITYKANHDSMSHAIQHDKNSIISCLLDMFPEYYAIYIAAELQKAIYFKKAPAFNILMSFYRMRSLHEKNDLGETLCRAAQEKHSPFKMHAIKELLKSGARTNLAFWEIMQKSPECMPSVDEYNKEKNTCMAHALETTLIPDLASLCFEYAQEKALTTNAQ